MTSAHGLFFVLCVSTIKYGWEDFVSGLQYSNRQLIKLERKGGENNMKINDKREDKEMNRF